VTVTGDMLRSHPGYHGGVDDDLLAACIDAVSACATACTGCVDASLAERDPSPLRATIRADQDCADICTTTAHVLSRRTAADLNVLRSLVEACRVACRRSVDAARSHADRSDHCRVCTEACRAAEMACAELLRRL